MERREGNSRLDFGRMIRENDDYGSDDIEKQKTKKAEPNFAWNEELDFLFVNCCFRFKVHIKESGKTLGDKFMLITAAMVAHPAFQGSDMTAQALQRKWDRIAATVKRTYALDSEGANLSGLGEEVSETDRLVHQMLKVKKDEKVLAEELKEKARERNAKMLVNMAGVKQVLC